MAKNCGFESKILSQKRYFESKYRWFIQTSIITLDIEKNANIFAENWQKSAKTVIIISKVSRKFGSRAKLSSKNISRPSPRIRTDARFTYC
jgi:hypothetical protein